MLQFFVFLFIFYFKKRGVWASVVFYLVLSRLIGRDGYNATLSIVVKARRPICDAYFIAFNYLTWLDHFCLDKPTINKPTNVRVGHPRSSQRN